jgi:two-component system, LytTR family, sensor histidine kinase AlgZ
VHPILSNRRTLALYLAIWLSIGLLIELPFIFSYKSQWSVFLLSDIPLNILFAFICLSSYYLCRFFPIKTTKWYNLLSMFIVASCVAAGIELLIGYAWIYFIDSLKFAAPIFPLYEFWTAGIFSTLVLIFLLIAATQYVIIGFEQSRESERQTLELQVLAQDAELRALRAQIDPHFLFNSLNSISALTTSDPTKARIMVILLAEFFRTSLDLGTKNRISLTEELSLIDKFLTIEQVRFGSRLQVQQDIDQKTLGCKIPPLLLQPLVENAVRHGISQLLEGGTITLRTRIHNGRLNIVIANPFDPDYVPKKGTGLGMKNVRSRMQTLYGNEGRIDVDKKDNIFTVEFSFPVRNFDR